ncbi:MAG: DUF1440 domain-containing protein [Chitinophagales bacterium]|nr:DUF1440 domain-containing protein [Chitinophagales bacterium]
MQSPLKTILTSGFLAGTLDLTTALVVYSVMLQKVTATRLLQSIASGVFGKTAYDGGSEMVIFGIVLHFMIAFSFAIFYFFIYPHIPFLKKQKIISGLLYGLFAWIIMNLIILPLVFSHLSVMTPNSIVIGATILMIMIGLPISIVTSKYYNAKSEPGLES